MRILFVTSRLPYPPDRGDRLRVYNFLKQISTQHQITLISFVESATETASAEALNPFCTRVITVPLTPFRSFSNILLGLLNTLPLQVKFYHDNKMKQTLTNILAEQPFDLVYTHLVRMAPYTEKLSEVYKILDMTDVISRELERSLDYRHYFNRLLFRLETRRLAAYEKQVALSFDETWLISEAEAAEFSARQPAALTAVVTNGINSDQFYPRPELIDPNTIAFIGHLRVFHNIDAAQYLAYQIFPLVRAELPLTQLEITGADPSPEVSALASETGIKVHGYVPDLNSTLNRAAVVVAPLRFASGIQNKVLEAMAAARPVVTTPMVNEGIAATPGKHLLLARTPQEFAQQIKLLLTDQKLQQKIGYSGYDFVHQHFSWNNALQRINKISDTRQHTQI
jgi:polysaccharide biosynthesis protein PslH